MWPLVDEQLYSSWIGSSLHSLLFSYTDLKIVNMCYTCSHGSSCRSHLTISLGGKPLSFRRIHMQRICELPPVIMAQLHNQTLQSTVQPPSSGCCYHTGAGQYLLLTLHQLTLSNISMRWRSREGQRKLASVSSSERKRGECDESFAVMQQPSSCRPLRNSHSFTPKTTHRKRQEVRSICQRYRHGDQDSKIVLSWHKTKKSQQNNRFGFDRMLRGLGWRDGYHVLLINC